MGRPSSTRISSLLEAAVCLAVALTACLTSVTVDLGSNYQEPLVEAQAPPPLTLVESGITPPIDAPDAQDEEPLEATADSAPVDEEATAPPAQICLNNKSFEPLLNSDAGPVPVLANPTYWQLCSANVLIPQACVLSPTDGISYLGLSIGGAPYYYNPGSVDQRLCAPLQPGVTYSLQLDFALDAQESDANPIGEPPALQIRGSTTMCDPQAELLLRFSGATNTCGWKSLCKTFVPLHADTHLILVPEASSSTGYIYSQTNLLVDYLQSGGACPLR
jgi:hypothetical protein